MKRILIITAVPPDDIFNMAVKDVSCGGEGTIDVYCPAVISLHFIADMRISEIISTNWHSAPFRYGLITAELVGKLRSRLYERIVVIYDDDFGTKAAALRRLAFKTNPVFVSAFNRKMVWSRLNGEQRLRRFLLPHKWFYSGVNVLITLELIIITFLMKTVSVRWRKR